MSFTSSARVGAAGSVDDSDLVLFTPTSLGETTAGTFSLYFDGSDIGLTKSDEDVDAVEIDGSNLYLSTSGGFATTGAAAGKDEDVFVCAGFTPGPDTACAGGTAVAFDGSAVGFGYSGADLDGFSFTGEGNVAEGQAFFSSTDAFTLPTAIGEDSDVFGCRFLEEPAGSPFADCGTAGASIRLLFSADNHEIEKDLQDFDFPF